MQNLRVTVEETRQSIARIEESLSARLSVLEHQFRHIGDNLSPDNGVKRTRAISEGQHLDKLLKLEQLAKLYGTSQWYEFLNLKL